MAKRPSCTLRIQSEMPPEVNIFSRYTPAKPESVAATSAAQTPRNGFAFAAAEDLASSLCTKTTPAVRRMKESHCGPRNDLPSRRIVKQAVEIVFS